MARASALGVALGRRRIVRQTLTGSRLLKV